MGLAEHIDAMAPGPFGVDGATVDAVALVAPPGAGPASDPPLIALERVSAPRLAAADDLLPVNSGRAERDLWPTDDWRPGLNFMLQALNIKKVKRAKGDPRRVLPVVLAHNLRCKNESHRPRRPPDARRTRFNETLAGDVDPDTEGELSWSEMQKAGFKLTRCDVIIGLEYVMQPPDGWDMPAFYAECLHWVRTDRQLRVASATVHRDQRRPHIHIIALPIHLGRFVSGASLTSGVNRLANQRVSFMAHIRLTLGLRPDRAPHVPGFCELTGTGAQTQSEFGAADLLAHQPPSPSGVTDLLAHQPPSPLAAADLLAQQPPGPDLILSDASGAVADRSQFGPDSIPAAPRTCAICSHQTRRKTCLEPVAAGLAPHFRIEFVELLPHDFARGCPAFTSATTIDDLPLFHCAADPPPFWHAES